VQAAVRCYTTHIADNGSGSLVLLDAMSLSWFCGAHGGRALVVEFVGEFFRDMVSYVGSFVTCCIGFQILCALLML
jgi:hypothetical protein